MGRAACRQYGISEQTHYRWKKQLGDISTSELKELRQLREAACKCGWRAVEAETQAENCRQRCSSSVAGLSRGRRGGLV